MGTPWPRTAHLVHANPGVECSWGDKLAAQNCAQSTVSLPPAANPLRLGSWLFQLLKGQISQQAPYSRCMLVAAVIYVVCRFLTASCHDELQGGGTLRGACYGHGPLQLQQLLA